jgi:hypothetical protein
VQLEDLDIEGMYRILDEASERLAFNQTVHRYWLEGKSIPGVTTTLDQADKPALDRWRVRVQIEADVKTAWELLRAGDQGWISFEQFAEDFKRLSGEKYEHERQSDAAKDTGKQVHALLEQNFKSQLEIPYELPDGFAISDEAQALFSGVLDWMRTVSFMPLAVERRVYSAAHWYAGTVDLFALVDGYKQIVDYKSRRSEGTHIWPEQRRQSAAYRVAAAEMGLGEWGGLLLMVPKDGGKVMPAPIKTPLEVDFGSFLACQTLYKDNKK